MSLVQKITNNLEQSTRVEKINSLSNASIVTISKQLK